MIRNQCRAYCQCEQCGHDAEATHNGTTRRTQPDTTLRNTTQRAMTAAAPCRNDGCNTVDALYKQCLLDSLRVRSLQASLPNAGKFVPDEQLRSVAAQREAAAFARASQLVPLRRRDRVQELLLLEHKERLREQARLRAERRALGLPDEDDKDDDGGDEAKDKTNDKDAEEAAKKQQQQQQDEEADATAKRGVAAPSAAVCGCEAETALRATLQTIRDIVDEGEEEQQQQQQHNSSTTPRPLTRNQVYALRHIVHTQTLRAREAAAASAHAPRLCGHCLDVDVQARHLCPPRPAAYASVGATATGAPRSALPVSDSTAFDMTGKVINPGEGIKYGTLRARDADGRYRSAAPEAAALTSNARMSGYNPHPYGAGVLFPALTNVTTSAAPKTMTAMRQGNDDTRRAPQQQQQQQSTATAVTTANKRHFVNNNIAADEAVDAALQYPGSTYNVYDRNTTAAAVDNGNDNGQSTQHGAQTMTRTAAAGEAARNGNGVDGDAMEATAMMRTVPAVPGATAPPSSSASLWRTTNQEREASLKRYMQYQKELQDTARKVYKDTSSRFTPAAVAATAPRA